MWSAVKRVRLGDQLADAEFASRLLEAGQKKLVITPALERPWQVSSAW
jgi:hypothetical protein